jgi:hypothetical protein
MELLIGLIIIAGLGYVLYNHYNTKPSNTAPVAEPEAPYKVETPVIPVLTQVLDVNGDGKVNLEDVKAVVKKTTKKAKETVKKATTKKPATKKAKTVKK